MVAKAFRVIDCSGNVCEIAQACQNRESSRHSADYHGAVLCSVVISDIIRIAIASLSWLGVQPSFEFHKRWTCAPRTIAMQMQGVGGACACTCELKHKPFRLPSAATCLSSQSFGLSFRRPTVTASGTEP